MKKLILTLLILNSLFHFATAQAPQKLWSSFFNGTLTGKDESNSVITDNAGNVYITGKSYNTSSIGNFTTAKYDSYGVQQWIDHVGISGTGNHNSGIKIVLDKWQNLYAIGTVASNAGDIEVIKYNENGKIWARNYEPYFFGSDEDFGVDICVDTLGNFYATGQVTSLSGNLWDSYNMKCDSSGVKIFEENYTNASGDDFPTAVAVTANGNFFAQSNSFNFFGSSTIDIFTINYLSNGNQNWISKFNNSPANGTDYGTCLKVDESSNQYICGTADAGPNNDMVVLKQNSYGTRLWAVTYNGTANDNDTAVSTSRLSNGFVVVTGKCKELLNGFTVDAMVTMVVDSGTIVWTNKFYGADSLGAIPSQMVIDVQGNIYICGDETLTSATKNGCIIKYNSNGNLLWNISYDAGLNLDDKFNSITLDYNNDIIVTGQTFTSTTNSNYLTVKYGNSTTAVYEIFFTENMVIYPNPAKANATIIFNTSLEKNISVSLTDLFGREIQNITNKYLALENNKINLDLSQLNNGVYVVRLNSNKSFMGKLIIEK